MKIVLKSELATDEIRNRLQAITEKFHTDSETKFQFEGKVSDSGFQILPTFDYGARNQLRPEIVGSVKRKGNSSFVELRFRLPYGLKILFSIVAFVNVGAIIFLYLNPIDHFMNWKILSAFTVVTFLIFYLTFRHKAKASTAVLCKTFDANIQR